MASSSVLPSSLQLMKEEEDKLREQFASSGGSSSYSSYSSYSSGGSIDDPHVHLVDVYSNNHTFVQQQPSAGEASLPLLFEQQNARQMGQLVIVDEATFKKNWDNFTSGSLKGLDWSNIFVAGGSILRCVDTFQVKEGESNGSDVDLFLYGLTDDQANEKIRSIFETVRANTEGSGQKQAVEIVRTKNAVTIIGNYPLRHVQIILRMYRSPAEVLMGFDIDSCTIGYDGSRVWALPRFRRAITKGYNLVDLSRRSLTYEIRLFKYSKRGFAVRVPGYRPTDIDSNLYDLSRPLKDVTGLARLLLLAHRGNTSTPAPVRPQPRKLDLRPDGFNDERLLEGKVGGGGGGGGLGSGIPVKAEDEDYILVFIPYGPRWFLHRTISLLTMRDKSQYFARKQTNPNDNSHVLVIGMDSVFSGRASWCKDNNPPPPPSPTKRDDYIRGALSWLRDNPGQQTDSNLLTGSFHPLKADDWERDALKSYGGQKGVIPPRPSPPPSAIAVRAKKAPAMKKKAVKVAHKKKTFGGFIAPKKSSGGWGAPTPSGFGAAPKASSGGFGAGSMTSGFGAVAPSSGGFGANNVASGGFGAPVPSSGGFGAPAASSGFGAPAPPSGGFGAPPAQLQAQLQAQAQAQAQARAQARAQAQAPALAFGSFGAPAVATPGQANPELEKSYKEAAPQETDTKLLLLLALLKKNGMLSVNDHSKLKDKVINGDANLVCALEVFEIDYDFNELADTLRLVANL